MTELRVIRKTQCGGCKKYFVGDSAFFAHRTGEYNRRRCLNTEEMIAQGYASERLLVKMYLENKPIRSGKSMTYGTSLQNVRLYEKLSAESHLLKMRMKNEFRCWSPRESARARMGSAAGIG